ncbi:DNA polymerase III subunit epsilon [Methyloterricola oryzae]|uniref:DNA polymerase III subunit epsilon n=1 Tax=Methyloterricola oryzae TaxID=1495050 RepID=UPI0005EAF485|nr:DNA polymerase III subunit epsilon [Methyloterricola oryzae]
MRQIVLDTETTGLNPEEGHRVIEIGCVEILNRRLTGNRFHVYINPEREIDPGAVEVHGLDNAFLADKPRFADIAQDFIAFVDGTELIIHNAPFDVGFLNAELGRLPDLKPVTDHCDVLDTLALARKKHPGQRNSLDALCKRYGVDNSQRELHGALLDAEILADVYLAMTGGQAVLLLEGDADNPGDARLSTGAGLVRPARRAARLPLPVHHCQAHELEAHERRLDAIDKASGGRCFWRMESPS